MPRLSCYVVGETSLPASCGEILLRGGHAVLGVVSADADVVRWARERDVPCVDPDTDLHELLAREPFDHLFSVNNLRLLPAEAVTAPRISAINFHDGPLPEYAGLNTPVWALLAGERNHAVSWHVMTAGIDEGEVLEREPVEIAPEDTALTLNAKCYEAAIRSFGRLAEALADGTATGEVQNLDRRTYFGKHKRPEAACALRWDRPAEELDRLVRALDFGEYRNPLGVPKALLEDRALPVAALEVLPERSEAEPGAVLRADGEAAVVATATEDVLVHASGLTEGERLPVLSQEDAAELTAYHECLARHEDFWAARLASAEPLVLPYARPATGEEPRSRTIELAQADADAAVAALLLYASRLAGKQVFDVGLRHRGDARVAAPVVPLRVVADHDAPFAANLDGIRDELATARERRSYMIDLTARGSVAPELSVAVDVAAEAEPAPGAGLTMVVSPDGARCTWLYDPGALDDDSVASMERQLKTFVRGLDERPLHEVGLVDDEDLSKLLGEWNETALDYRRDACVHELFEAQAERTPDAVALVAGDQELTYAELDARSTRLARHLQELGVGPDARVGVYVPRSADMVIGLMAILKAGGSYVPMDPAYPAKRIAFMIADAEVPVLLATRDAAGNLPDHAAEVVLLDALPELADGAVEPGVGPDDLAYVIYTSGSTGKPKGVMVTHRNVVNFFAGMDERIEYDEPADRAPGENAGVWLAETSISFDISVLELFWTLARGFKVVLFTGREPEVRRIRRRAPAAVPRVGGNGFPGAEVAVLQHPIAALIEEHGVTHFQCTPSMASMLLASPGGETAFRSLDQLLVGGEAFPVVLARQLRRLVPGTIENVYGPTETTIWSSTFRLGGADGEDTVLVGRPLANQHLYVLDGRHRPVPVGVPGELCIGGDGVTRGYLNRPELNAERFLADPFRGDGARLYRTGDLARFRPDGNVEFLGRMDNQVKLRGYRIELGEIETVLADHPAVQEAAVVARTDGPGADPRLVAYLVPANGALPSLRGYAEERLPEYMVPAVFQTLDAMPRTPNGKLDRKALPAPAEKSAAERAAFVGPRDDIERRLVDLWERQLGVKPIGVHDSFFDLGGHSLLAVRLFGEIEKELGRRLPLATLFDAPTVETLAEILRDERSAPTRSSLVEIQPEGSKPPFFCVHAHGGHVMFYYDLARHLGPDQPLYGLQAQGLDGSQEPLRSFEEMAARYIEEMQAVQPEGPYHLGGDCLGGVIAYEMAHQLRAAGHEVALLAMFDTFRPGWPKLRAHVPRPAYGAMHVGHIARFHMRNVLRLRGRERVAYLADRVRRVVFGVRGKTEKLLGRPSPLVRTQGALGEAYDRYEPQPYDGTITLLRATRLPSGIEDAPDLGWGELAAGGVDVHELPIYFMTGIVQPNVQLLAETLAGCLAEAEPARLRLAAAG